MMTYDGLTLAAVVAELQNTIVRGRIQGVRQHNESDLTFEIRSHNRTYFLFMSVNARFARVYLSATNKPVPQTPPNFCQLLRKYVKGAFITAVEQSEFDRVLIIHTEAPDGNRNELILELMGRHSNAMLISDSGIILGAAKFISAAVSRYRQVLPGREYTPPPGNKSNPIDITREEFDSQWCDLFSEGATADQVKQWLVAAFSGIGPFIAEDIMAQVESPTADAVWSALEWLRGIVKNKQYSPRLITSDRGAAIYAYPIKTIQYPEKNQFERESMNETLDTLYRELITGDQFESTYSSLETSIKRAIAWREQVERGFNDAISEGEKSERYKEIGELILGNQGTIEKGQKTAKMIDYYNPEMPEIEVQLDEKSTPKENAERYFRRFKKAREGAQLAVTRLKENQESVELLKYQLEALSSIKTTDELNAIRDALTKRGLLRVEVRPEAGAKQESEFGTAKIRKTMSSDGYQILFGENSESNDYLTTKVARPSDLWFHARSVTGAHVVVRAENKPDLVPKSTLREAALIAAKNSDAKHSSLVAVDYTQKKYVRKKRGAPHGFVTYQNERTIDIAPHD